MSRWRDQTQLELAFDRAVRSLKSNDITSEEYARKLDVAIKLHKMISEEKSSYVSKDVMASIGANLLGIFMIIKHEHVNVITSRAMNWVMKPFTKF
jgi:hypothetical protein